MYVWMLYAIISCYVTWKRQVFLFLKHTYIHFSACEQGPYIYMEYLFRFETSAL